MSTMTRWSSDLVRSRRPLIGDRAIATVNAETLVSVEDSAGRGGAYHLTRSRRLGCCARRHRGIRLVNPPDERNVLISRRTRGPRDIITESSRSRDVRPLRPPERIFTIRPDLRRCLPIGCRRSSSPAIRTSTTSGMSWSCEACWRIRSHRQGSSSFARRSRSIRGHEDEIRSACLVSRAVSQSAPDRPATSGGGMMEKAQFISYVRTRPEQKVYESILRRSRCSTCLE
jgi:hypothetical protein